MAVRVEGCMECSWGRRNESNGVESVNTMKENESKENRDDSEIAKSFLHVCRSKHGTASNSLIGKFNCRVSKRFANNF